jgi:hypothetical protein
VLRLCPGSDGYGWGAHAVVTGRRLPSSAPNTPPPGEPMQAAAFSSIPLAIDGRPCNEPEQLGRFSGDSPEETAWGLVPGTILTVRGKLRRVVMVWWHPRTGRLHVDTEAAA